MPSAQKLREHNRSLREENDRLKVSIREHEDVIRKLRTDVEELTANYKKLRQKYDKQKDIKGTMDAWIDMLAQHVLHYRKFLRKEFGYADELSDDYMQQTRNGTVAYYLRPYAHYVPQLLTPGVMYVFDRHCLTCGLVLPSRFAYGKCTNCPRGAWYCSNLCQKAHWPVHKRDHPPHRPDWAGFSR